MLLFQKQTLEKEKEHLLELRERILPHFALISLGSTCYPRIFINYLNKNRETHFFDWIGSSVWSVNELIKNDFEHLNSTKEYYILQHKRIHCICHRKYFLRFVHDAQVQKILLKNQVLEKIQEIQEKYLRRAQRFVQLLQCKKQKKLFFYFQDVKPDRLEYLPDDVFVRSFYPSNSESSEDYLRQLYDKERQQMQEFKTTLLEKYNLQEEDYKIIYLVLLEHLETVQIDANIFQLKVSNVFNIIPDFIAAKELLFSFLAA